MRKVRPALAPKVRHLVHAVRGERRELEDKIGRLVSAASVAGKVNVHRQEMAVAPHLHMIRPNQRMPLTNQLKVNCSLGNDAHRRAEDDGGGEGRAGRGGRLGLFSAEAAADAAIGNDNVGRRRPLHHRPQAALQRSGSLGRGLHQKARLFGRNGAALGLHVQMRLRASGEAARRDNVASSIVSNAALL